MYALLESPAILLIFFLLLCQTLILIGVLRSVKILVLLVFKCFKQSAFFSCITLLVQLYEKMTDLIQQHFLPSIKVALRALHAVWNHRSAINLVGNHIDVLTGRWTAQDSGIGECWMNHQTIHWV